ncbi:MAG: sulfite exporter TauE/SafE family protein [Methylohalobius sp.]|nr:sulfite exporter TauE/SafE family protein [Methylohalobius sp.]
MPAVNKRWLYLAIGVVGLVLVVYLDQRMRGHGHSPFLGEMSYALAFMTGFFTSFHCVGMCGALVLGYTTHDAALGRPQYLSHLWYAVGKTLSYTVLGAAFATLGGIIAFTPSLRGGIALVAGVFLILFGLNLLGILRFRVQLPTPAFLMRFIGRQYRQRSHPFVIGLANGLMIVCGPLQAMYVLAASTGDPLQGAALLFLFGIGTLPMLIGFGIFATTLAKGAAPMLVKLSSAAVVVMGAVMLNRGLILTQSGYDLDSLITSVRQRWEFFATAPVTTITMRVTKEGFVPSHFTLEQGQAVRWEVEVAEDAFCQSRLEIPSFGVHLDLRPGQQAIEFAPPRSGLILWRCLQPERYGAFTVLQKNSKIEKSSGAMPPECH